MSITRGFGLEPLGDYPFGEWLFTSVVEIVNIEEDILRVTFSGAVKHVDAGDSDDALNPANYFVVRNSTGVYIPILSVSYIADDSIFELQLQSDLLDEEYKLLVSNVIDSYGELVGNDFVDLTADDDTIAFYRFNEPSGTIANDAGPNGFNATVDANYSATEAGYLIHDRGRIVHYVDNVFRGIVAAHDAAMDFVNEGSFKIWITPNTFNHASVNVIAAKELDSNNGWLIFTDSSYNLKFAPMGLGGATIDLGAALVPNVANYIGIDFKVSTNKVRAFLNGSKIYDADPGFTLNLSNINSSADLCIGCPTKSNNSQILDAIYDEFKISSVLIDENEYQSEYGSAVREEFTGFAGSGTLTNVLYNVPYITADRLGLEFIVIYERDMQALNNYDQYSTTNPANYRFELVSGTGITPNVQTIFKLTPNRYKVVLDKRMTIGVIYKVSAGGMKDNLGNILSFVDNHISFTAVSRKPSFVSVTPVTTDSIRIAYDFIMESINPVGIHDVLNPNNYVITNTQLSIGVNSVTKLSDSIFVLNIDPMSELDIAASITINNVWDQSKNTLNPSTITRVFPGIGIKPVVSSIIPISTTECRVVFSKAVLHINSSGTYDALNKDNYSIPGLTISNSVEIAPNDGTTFKLTFTQEMSGGKAYSITVDNIRDEYVNTMHVQTIKFSGFGVPPVIQSIAVVDDNIIRIIFSEEMLSTCSCMKASSYRIIGSDSRNVIVKEVEPEVALYPTYVDLTLSRLKDGMLYSGNIVKDLYDTSNNLLSGTTFEFTAALTSFAELSSVVPVLIGGLIKTLNIEYSIEMDDEDVLDLNNYNLSIASGTGALPGIVSISKTGFTTYRILLNGEMTDFSSHSTTYELEVTATVKDSVGNLIDGASRSVVFNGDAVLPKLLKAVSTLSEMAVRIEYDKPMKHVSDLNSDDALNPSNYSIPGTTVTEVIHTGASKNFKLSLSTLDETLDYTITVENVEDLSSNIIDSIHDTYTFKGDLTGAALIDAVALTKYVTEIVFDREVVHSNPANSGDALNPESYTISTEGINIPVISVVESDPPANGKIFKITSEEMVTGTSNINLICNGVKDLNGISRNSSINYSGIGENPTIISVKALSNRSIKITFSEQMLSDVNLLGSMSYTLIDGENTFYANSVVAEQGATNPSYVSVEFNADVVYNTPQIGGKLVQLLVNPNIVDKIGNKLDSESTRIVFSWQLE